MTKRLTDDDLNAVMHMLPMEWATKLSAHLSSMETAPTPEDVARDVEKVRQALRRGPTSEWTADAGEHPLSRLATSAARVPGLEAEMERLEERCKVEITKALTAESERDAARASLECKTTEVMVLVGERDAARQEAETLRANVGGLDGKWREVMWQALSRDPKAETGSMLIISREIDALRAKVAELERERDDARHIGNEAASHWKGLADGWMETAGKAEARATAAEAALAELAAKVNTPEVDDFMRGVPLEAAHQQERWGAEHDAGKTDADWFWLIGYLAGKALRPDATPEKKRHHLVATAAACLNWHHHLLDHGLMRPGIAPSGDAADAQPTSAPGLREAVGPDTVCLHCGKRRAEHIRRHHGDGPKGTLWYCRTATERPFTPRPASLPDAVRTALAGPLAWMLGPESDWKDGEVGVGHGFRGQAGEVHALLTAGLAAYDATPPSVTHAALVLESPREALREWIRTTGKTQRAVAATLGMSESGLSRILSGENSPGDAAAADIGAMTGGRIPATAWRTRMDRRMHGIDTSGMARGELMPGSQPVVTHADLAAVGVAGVVALYEHHARTSKPPIASASDVSCVPVTPEALTAVVEAVAKEAEEARGVEGRGLGLSGEWCAREVLRRATGGEVPPVAEWREKAAKWDAAVERAKDGEALMRAWNVGGMAPLEERISALLAHLGLDTPPSYREATPTCQKCGHGEHWDVGAKDRAPHSYCCDRSGVSGPNCGCTYRPDRVVCSGCGCEGIALCDNCKPTPPSGPGGGETPPPPCPECGWTGGGECGHPETAPTGPGGQVPESLPKARVVEVLSAVDAAGSGAGPSPLVSSVCRTIARDLGLSLPDATPEGPTQQRPRQPTPTPNVPPLAQPEPAAPEVADDEEPLVEFAAEDCGRVWVMATGEWGHEGGSLTWALDALAHALAEARRELMSSIAETAQTTAERDSWMERCRKARAERDAATERATDAKVSARKAAEDMRERCTKALLDKRDTLPTNISAKTSGIRGGLEMGAAIVRNLKP